MRTSTLWTAALLRAFISPAAAEDSEHLAMSRVRLSTEPAVARGCTKVGKVSDDSVKDLRKKIVRDGGDTGILTFSTDNMSTIHAEVYKCPPARSPAPKK